MGRLAIALLSLLLVVQAAQGAPRKGIRFWNLTSSTVTRLQLAPAGTQNFGPDQCQNDPDGVVDHDERLKITDTAPGIYDVKFADKGGRTCIVRGIEVKTGAIFSIEEKSLKEGTK